jgi:hypothetical protein
VAEGTEVASAGGRLVPAVAPSFGEPKPVDVSGVDSAGLVGVGFAVTVSELESGRSKTTRSVAVVGRMATARFPPATRGATWKR